MAGTIALVAVAVCLGLLVIALARLVAVLDEAEVVLRGLVTGVRSARRSVTGAVSLAGAVGRDMAAGEEALSTLEALKAPGSQGRPEGRLTGLDGSPVGPVSPVIRPHPDPGRPIRARGGPNGKRSPDQRGEDRA